MTERGCIQTSLPCIKYDEHLKTQLQNPDCLGKLAGAAGRRWEPDWNARGLGSTMRNACEWQAQARAHGAPDTDQTAEVWRVWTIAGGDEVDVDATAEEANARGFREYHIQSTEDTASGPKH